MNVRNDGARLPRTESITREPFPGSRKIYVEGSLHPDVGVPMREISLSPTMSRVSGDVVEEKKLKVSVARMPTIESVVAMVNRPQAIKPAMMKRSRRSRRDAERSLPIFG